MTILYSIHARTKTTMLVETYSFTFQSIKTVAGAFTDGKILIQPNRLPGLISKPYLAQDFKLRILYQILILSLTFLSLSCVNPFAPGWDDTESKGICPPLTEIDGVFCNFRNAYAFKDTSMYGNLIAPEFTFIYRDYEKGVDVSWGRDDEMRTTYGLFQSAQNILLIWNNIVATSGDSVKQTIIRGFSLTITFNPSDIVRVDGYANLTFQRDENSQWKIIRWRDESNF